MEEWISPISRIQVVLLHQVAWRTWWLIETPLAGRSSPPAFHVAK